MCRVSRVQLSLSAFNMRAITNFNEVTYHFLRAIFEHLHLTKGGAGGGAQVRSTTQVQHTEERES